MIRSQNNPLLLLLLMFMLPSCGVTLNVDLGLFEETEEPENESIYEVYERINYNPEEMTWIYTLSGPLSGGTYREYLEEATEDLRLHNITVLYSKIIPTSTPLANHSASDLMFAAIILNFNIDRAFDAGWVPFTDELLEGFRLN